MIRNPGFQKVFEHELTRRLFILVMNLQSITLMLHCSKWMKRCFGHMKSSPFVCLKYQSETWPNELATVLHSQLSVVLIVPKSPKSRITRPKAIQNYQQPRWKYIHTNTAMITSNSWEVPIAYPMDLFQTSYASAQM